MTEDVLVKLYEQGSDLAREKRLAEAAAVYQQAYDYCTSSSEADSKERQKVFAGKLAALYYSLRNFEKGRPFYLEIGQIPPKPPCELRDLKAGLTVLKKLNMLAELKPKLQKKIFEEAFDGETDLTGDALPDFLSAYYGYHMEDTQPESDRVTPITPRAIADGATWYDHRFANDSDDLFADFCTLLGGEPICVSKELDFSSSPFTVLIQNGAGELIHLDVNDIEDIVAYFNQELAVTGDKRRFVSVETGGDYSFWMLCDQEKFKILFRKGKGVFDLVDIPGVDEKAWLKIK